MMQISDLFDEHCLAPYRHQSSRRSSFSTPQKDVVDEDYPMEPNYLLQVSLMIDPLISSFEYAWLLLFPHLYSQALLDDLFFDEDTDSVRLYLLLILLDRDVILTVHYFICHSSWWNLWNCRRSKITWKCRRKMCLSSRHRYRQWSSTHITKRYSVVLTVCVLFSFCFTENSACDEYARWRW